MSYKHVVVPNIQILNANAQPTPWLIGAPPVTAYAGFAHAFALAMGADKHDGVGVVHHGIQFLGDIENDTLLPHQYRAASFIDKDDYAASNKYILSSQPTVRCHLNVSVIIRLNNYSTLDFKKVDLFLRGGRLAGGAIISHDFDAKTCVLNNEAYSLAVKPVIGPGYAVHERQDLMCLIEDDADVLDTLLRVTRPGKGNSEGESWLQPTTLGYAQITPVSQRRDSRNNLPHAYVESLVGLVQYKDFFKYDVPFWQYSYPEPGVFVLTTK